MSEGDVKSGRYREILSRAGAFVLGAVLVIATVGKIVDPIVFVEQIRQEGLDILFSANTVALIALALETVLGIALILGVRSSFVLVPSAALVAFFVFLTGRSYWLVLAGLRENTYDCGCFGVFLHRTATEAFWQDLLLLVPPLLLAFASPRAFRQRPAVWKAALAGLGTLAVLLYAIYGGGLPGSPEPELEVVDVGKAAFRPSEQFVLVIGGIEDPTARIYESDLTLQFLIISSRLPQPLVLDVRSSVVSELAGPPVPALSEEIVMPAPLALAAVTNFSVSSEGLGFDYRGQPFLVRNRN